MVIQGIPSPVYIYDDKTRKFILCQNPIALPNESVPSLKNTLHTFCILGTHYKRIMVIN